VAKLAEIFLGILTATGGFVEIGELTFTLNAGRHFGYSLLWIVVLGTVGIMVFGEMAGRIAAVRRRAVFHLIREHIGFDLALLTLVAALIVNLLTCAAEIGGVAMLLQLMAGGSSLRLYAVVAGGALLVTVWYVSFRWIERIFGLGGLLLIVFSLAFLSYGPDWSAVGRGFVPGLPQAAADHDLVLYFFYAVALLSSIMLPYETYFYASGGIEDRWTAADVPLNRLVVITGFTLGGMLSASLVGVGAEFFAPHQVEPQLPGSAALGVSHSFGTIGLVAALLGMLFAFGGAAIETALSSAYNLAQFAGWPWGKHEPKRKVRRFTMSWVVLFVAAAALALSGASPVKVVEYSIVLSVVILPLSYWPILKVAGDERVMGANRNGVVSRALGWFYYALICVAAVAAIPLLVLTHGGEG
jgi:Mn2+/Fe2+ NRAMP family transporter